MAHCYACKNKLETLSEDFETDFQYRKALWIGFHGAYGMFIESKTFTDSKETDVIKDASYEAVICEDCANDLCGKIDWMRELIQLNQPSDNTDNETNTPE